MEAFKRDGTGSATLSRLVAAMVPSRDTLAVMSLVYGDSTPFPHDVDYIALLDDGIDCALKLVSAQHALQAARRQIDQVHDDEQLQLGALTALLEQTQEACQPAIATGTERGRQTAQQVLASARQVVDAAVSSVAGEASEKASQGRALLDAARDASYRAIEHFVGRNTPPRSSLGLRLSTDAGGGVAKVSIGTPFDLKAVFSVEMPATHFWSRHRRAGELVPSIEVSLPKASGWLSKRVEMKALRLDRLFVSDVKVRDGGGSVQLRKGAGSGAGYEMRVETQGEVAVSVCPIADDGTVDTQHPLSLEGSDGAAVLGLWQLIGDSSTDLYSLRKSMASARFGNHALESFDSPVAVAEALVRDLAPVVVEISRRSGAPGELVLRRDVGPRRREEMYVTHTELLTKIFTLPPEQRQIFSSFGLASDELGTVLEPTRSSSSNRPAYRVEPPPRRQSSSPSRAAESSSTRVTPVPTASSEPPTRRAESARGSRASAAPTRPRARVFPSNMGPTVIVAESDDVGSSESADASTRQKLPSPANPAV